MAFENAVPPACASIPTEDSAVASAKMSDSDIPTCVPADARFVAMSIMSASVVWKLFPKSTIVLPIFEYFSSADIDWSAANPVTFANFAIAVAASSAARFVEFPISIMTRVNPKTS